MRPTLVSGWRRLALLTLPLLLGGGVIVGALALHTSTPAALTTPAAAGSISGAKADLNTATAEELATIPGFTSDLAAAVVAQREQFGPFNSIRELVTVLGMGAAEYAQAKKHVRV